MYLIVLLPQGADGLQQSPPLTKRRRERVREGKRKGEEEEERWK